MLTSGIKCVTRWPLTLFHSVNLTSCSLALCSFYFLMFNTFRLPSLNAHLPLWTRLSSNRNNPIICSDCDAWMWAVTHSHSLRVGGGKCDVDPSQWIQVRRGLHPSELQEHRADRWYDDGSPGSAGWVSVWGDSLQRETVHQSRVKLTGNPWNKMPHRTQINCSFFFFYKQT